MKRKNLLKSFILILSVIIILIEGLWIIAVPEALIRERIISYLPQQIELNIEGLKKGLFFNLSMEGLTIKKDPIEIRLRDVRASLHYPSLLRGKLQMAIKAFAKENGYLQGIISPSGDIRLKADEISLSSIKNPFLKGEASIFIEGEIVKKVGTIRFELKDARLEPVKEEGLYVPLNLIDTIRGGLYIKEKEITLESVTLSGKDLYGRLKGKIINGEADLVLELMPEGELNSTLMLLIPSKMVSPGYYRMEIRYHMQART